MLPHFFGGQWEKYRSTRDHRPWARIDDLFRAEERGLTLEVLHMLIADSS